MAFQPPIVLHHYVGSAYSQKILWALAIKKLDWVSVEVPPILPRPLLQPLTHGYRRIPILQMGSDIFVDTALILQELEKRFPEPSLFPKRKGSDKADRGLAQALSMWTDRYFWSATVALMPYGGSNDPPDAPKIYSQKALLQDRAALMGIKSFDLERIAAARPVMLDKLRTNFEWIELQLSDGREWIFDTPYPSIADIHVGTNIWFLRNTKGAPEVARKDLYPNIYAWFARLHAYAKANGKKPVKMTGEQALEIAKKHKPMSHPATEDANDPNGRKIGDHVRIIPDDYGKIPVQGKIVSLGPLHIAIRPDGVSETGIDVVIWFPRVGYLVNPATPLVKL
ncbi:9039_t:CDS:2 [Paraglomus occultum]|uniref:9039_t:CDS:1 n=1 Tax=Paraglomus occultum TaxID=144539 RepID=A0A9N9CE08_9GLOM|nr:9039_t:CDS:2 [Paraglomus occultum]